jgi:hypothetical protein
MHSVVLPTLAVTRQGAPVQTRRLTRDTAPAAFMDGALRPVR